MLALMDILLERKLLKLAGIKDAVLTVRGDVRGKTRYNINVAQATLNVA